MPTSDAPENPGERAITSPAELAAALADTFLSNAEAGRDAANDTLVAELIAWKREQRARSTPEGNAMITPATRAEAEFPTLDLSELDDAPSRRVRYVPAISYRELPAILAARLPHVVHAHRALCRTCDVHEFIDTDSGDSARYVLTVDEHGATVADLAETGTGKLWPAIEQACDRYERDGRTLPGDANDALVTRGGGPR